MRVYWRKYVQIINLYSVTRSKFSKRLWVRESVLSRDDLNDATILASVTQPVVCRNVV